MFIKDNTLRDVDSTMRCKAPIFFVRGGVSQEYILLISELEFMFVERSKKREARATKGLKKLVVT